MDQSPTKTRPTLVKAANGNFYNLTVFMDDEENMFLTLVDRFSKKQLCNRAVIPQLFINSVPDEGFDSLEAVKKALIDKIKTTAEL